MSVPTTEPEHGLQPLAGEFLLRYRMAVPSSFKSLLKVTSSDEPSLPIQAQWVKLQKRLASVMRREGKVTSDVPQNPSRAPLSPVAEVGALKGTDEELYCMAARRQHIPSFLISISRYPHPLGDHSNSREGQERRGRQTLSSQNPYWGLALSPKLEYSGMTKAHCSLDLPCSSNPPTSAGFCHVTQADLKLLDSRNLPTSASQSVEITDVSHHAHPLVLKSGKIRCARVLPCPTWLAEYHMFLEPSSGLLCLFSIGSKLKEVEESDS
ncbi:hypothetical protein AAY473_021569 [Plecturocebus cupreus]